ncbi:EAL domain-containing protein [uncultured Roseibium sp.]|uniref:putative bifunctional diguanylate cyclase/phosphodiesterase n=1 Tax=uncultured Roseibium sp. TaxID=1936171 RepID=UPI00321764AE
MKLEKLKNLFSVPSGDPELTLAQFDANTRQLPMMYALLLVNTWALVATFWNLAPRSLTFYIPVGLSVLVFVRLVRWRRSISKCPDAATALKSLKQTNTLAPLIAAGFSAWSLALYPYGDAYAQGHVAFFMGITVVGCIFSLMHMLSAAFNVTMIVNAAFIVFFGFSGNPVFMANAGNLIFVSIALLVIVSINYNRFVSLIGSQRQLIQQQNELVQKQKETLELSNENYRLANLDSLTNLPNRRCFFSEFAEKHASAAMEQAPLIIGLIDLDGFKAVNDLYGHAVGDKLLVSVAERLKVACQGDLLLSRLGGDEFAILINLELSDENLMQIGQNLCTVLEAPFNLAEATLSISASIGFARWQTGIQCDELYENADFALYSAKRSRDAGSSHVVLFGKPHEARIQRTKLLEKALRSDTVADEMGVAFQPVVDVNSRAVVAFEALARWTSPTLGMVPPGDFIPAAERAGLINPLTLVLFRQALICARTWPEDVRLSFNLSAANIAKTDYVRELVDEIHNYGVAPNRIDFEITETAIIRDVHRAQEAIAELKQTGVRISLDDFGTGYSSLSHLHSFPLDKIKVDRSFVTNIGENSAGYGIVKSLLNLSRDMNIGCIIEGVETEEELAIIRSLGGEMVQGYYYSKPIPGDAVLDYLASLDGISEERFLNRA